MTIPVERETEIKLNFDEAALIRRVAEAALDAENCPYEAEVDVLLTDDEAIREINKAERGIDRATDVLSFPAVDLPAGRCPAGLTPARKKAIPWSLTG